MAILTTGWIMLASTITGKTATCITAFFSSILLLFALYFMYTSLRFPKLTNEGHKRIRMWYGIIFGAIGAIIGTGSAILSATGKSNFIIPYSALIIGLLFYPMAPLFERKVDYYIATWACIIAIIGIYMTTHTVAQGQVFVLIGTGIAMVTAAYGLYMLITGFKMIKRRMF
jgi:hypothetical protein